MPTLAYRILNVFIRGGERLSGNPLCVFEHGDGLDTGTLQALARQFNLSETTFLLHADDADAGVRIFTPDFEMPFAGHPTLGSAHVCRALGRGGDTLTLRMPAGLIPVRAHGDRWTLTARPPTWRELDVPRDELATLLGVSEQDIGERPLRVKSGKEQLIVPLTSPEAVRRVRPTAQAMDRLQGGDGRGSAYVFATTGPGTLLARYFFPSGPAVLEDPATGSATANLGGWMLAMGRDLPCRFTISQGEQALRPSILELEVDAARGIHVGGTVIELGRGAIELD